MRSKPCDKSIFAGRNIPPPGAFQLLTIQTFVLSTPVLKSSSKIGLEADCACGAQQTAKNIMMIRSLIRLDCRKQSGLALGRGKTLPSLHVAGANRERHSRPRGQQFRKVRASFQRSVSLLVEDYSRFLTCCAYLAAPSGGPRVPPQPHQHYCGD